MQHTAVLQLCARATDLALSALPEVVAEEMSLASFRRLLIDCIDCADSFEAGGVLATSSQTLTPSECYARLTSKLASQHAKPDSKLTARERAEFIDEQLAVFKAHWGLE